MKYFFDEDSNLLVFAVFKQMHNLNEICIMQYNIITTSVFKYLKLLSIGETSVKSIPSLHMAVFSKLFTFRKMHENHFLLNEKDDDQRILQRTLPVEYYLKKNQHKVFDSSGLCKKP